MKKTRYPNLNDYDLSAYEELKGDILYRINGGKVMDQADMYAMQQADAHHDEETKQEILSNYITDDTPTTPPAGTQTTPPPTSTTPATTNTTTPTTNNTTTPTSTTPEKPKQSTASGSGSDSGSGGCGGSGSGGGGDNALNFSGTLCKQENDGYPSYIDPKDKTITANIYSKKGVEQAFAAYTVLYDRGYSFRLTDGSQIIHTFTGKENVEKYVRSLNAKESKPNNTNISYSSTNNYSSNESDSDKRYNAVNSKNGHLMTINIKDKKNFGDYADYYLTVGKYGAAGTPIYDGIGLINDEGQIVCILNDEKSVSTHYRRLNPKEIDNTAEAFFHYFNNDGNPVVLGDKVFQDIQYVNAESSHYNNIITGVTEESNGSYGVDMVKEGCPSLFRDFFVGRTRIDYSITTYDKYSEIQFTASTGDGFWDPNYLSKNPDDGIGPNKEFAGGTVYPFISRTWTETMPNPSVMNWIK